MTNENKKHPIGYMHALTVEITFSEDNGGYIYKVWPKGVAEAAEADEEDTDEGNDNGGLCTGNMGDAVAMAADAALIVVRDHFSDNVFNLDVCPSSLDESGEPLTDGETDHKWNDTPETNEEGEHVIKCSECGAEKA